MGKSTYQNDTVGDAMGAGVEKQAQKVKAISAHSNMSITSKCSFS